MRVQPFLHRAGVLLWAFMLSVLLTAPASAQVDTGTILGTVKDQSGGVLPGATVTITHEGQAFTLSSVTREDGTFVFTPIRTGTYAIDVEFPGFKKGVRRGITVSIQQTGGGRLRPPAWRRRRGARGHRGRAAAPDGHRHGRRDPGVRGHREPPDQRTRLHHPRAPQRRGRAAAARRARAADVFRQRRQAGAEQLPARRDRQQHEQRGLPERRGLHRQAAGRRRRRDQDHDELLQRRVRPRRRRGAEHDAQVGDEQAARERLGVPPQRRDERQRLLRQPRQHQEGRVPVEPVRVHGGRADHRLEDVLVRRLRGERHPAGAHVGPDGSDRGPARERLHELLGSHHPAERHRRRRRARAHLPARHGLRPGHDASAPGRPGRSGHRHRPPRARASCAMRSPATAFRRTGSIRTPFG